MRLRRREEPPAPEVSVEAPPIPEVERRPLPPQLPPPSVVRSMATPAERAAARRRLDRQADDF